MTKAAGAVSQPGSPDESRSGPSVRDRTTRPRPLTPGPRCATFAAECDGVAEGRVGADPSALSTFNLARRSS